MKKAKRSSYLWRSLQLLNNILLKGRYNFEFDLMDVRSQNMPLAKRFNLLRAGLNLFTMKMSPWSWPLYMQVELTNYCNLKCKTCPTGNGTLGRKPAAIDLALFESFVNEVSPYLLTMSLFAWGESLLHPQLAEILRLTQNRGVTTFLSTNGQNLDDPQVQKALIEYPPSYLIVAIDGITDQTNAAYRTGAKLAPALKGVRNLAQIKQDRSQQYPILHHRYIIMKHNEHEVSQLPQFSAENGFDLLTLRTLSIIDTPDQISHKKLIPDNQIYRAYDYKDDKLINRTDFICEKPFVNPSLLVDGTVVACCQDFNGKYPLGTIADGSSFADVWWSKKANSLRNTMHKNPERFSMCFNCPYRDRPVNTTSIQRFDLKKYG